RAARGLGKLAHDNARITKRRSRRGRHGHGQFRSHRCIARLYVDRLHVAQMHAFHADVRFRAALKAERKDRGHDGNIADMKTIRHARLAAIFPIAHADGIRPSVRASVAEHAAGAFDQWIAALIRKHEYWIKLRGDDLHADFLAGARLEAIEIDGPRAAE